MRVVPEKSERSANQRTAQDRQLADARDVLNLEVGRPAIVAADIRQHRQSAAAITVQPIARPSSHREIHRIRRARDDDGNENQKRHECERPQVGRTQQRVDHQSGWTRLRNGIISSVE